MFMCQTLKKQQDVEQMSTVSIQTIICLHRTYLSCKTIKGLAHPKMKTLSLITHPHVIPNP